MIRSFQRGQFVPGSTETTASGTAATVRDGAGELEKMTSISWIPGTPACVDPTRGPDRRGGAPGLLGLNSGGRRQRRNDDGRS